MFWHKDDRQFRIIQGFRWGAFTIETTDDNPPEGINKENPYGIELYSYDSSNAPNGAELDHMTDGWLGDFEWDDEFTEEEQEKIQELWEEESFEGLEEAGWSNTETEAWFYGPLKITEIENT